MYKRIAVAFDESAEAGRAFRSALDLAKLLGSELYLITVLKIYRHTSGISLPWRRTYPEC
jgi:nucleotide-binding universal stress UspA family protein